MTMKFRAHDTFFIRKGWLSKGMKYVQQNPCVFVDKEKNPMDVLGIGANMVKALRYWLQAVGLTEETAGRRREQHFTELGSCIYAHDRYLEETGTLCLLQYRLATNLHEATSWYCFFNCFTMHEFTKEDFVLQLQKFIDEREPDSMPALRSMDDDFMCIVNTYLPRYKVNANKISAENNIDCPLGELGLIDIANKKKKTYRKAAPIIAAISPWVMLAFLNEYADGQDEISLSSLLTGERSIGRVFNLDAVNLLDVLHKIERLGEAKVIRTAGLDVVRLTNKRTFLECVEHYYKEIEE